MLIFQISMNTGKPQPGMRLDSGLSLKHTLEENKDKKRPTLDGDVNNRLKDGDIQSDKQPSPKMDSPQESYQTKSTQDLGMKREDFNLMLTQNLGLFEKPKIKQPSPNDPELQTAVQSPSQQPRLRLIFEADPVNTFLVTNPTAIFKFIRPDRFLKLKETEQVLVIEKLEELLKKCPQNAHLISEQVVTLNVSRSNQETLDYFRRKIPNCIEQGSIDEPGQSPRQAQPDSLNSSSQDIVFQLVHIGLRFFGKSAVKSKLAIQIVDIIRTICRGRRYLKCHLELVYQFVKTKVNKILAGSLFLKKGIERQKSQEPKLPSKEGFSLVEYCIQVLAAIIEHPNEFIVQPGEESLSRVPNYFYFSGYLSGILLGDKPASQWPFNKGFAACLWFRLHESQAQLQDIQNLPVLFNCFSAGYGGFECYFLGSKLYYRILPPLNYTPPTADSNGVLIADFQPGKWNFLAIEHEKPFLARAQLIAVVNDKQVVNFPMDYPSFDKQNAKLNIVSVCKNFTGQLSSFMLFKDQVNNPYKFVQIYKAYEYGIGAKQNFTKLNPDIFDSKFTEKLFLMFTPQRTQNKQVYDYIDQNDGEMLINCGVWSQPARPFLAETGGLLSLLPLLENISKLVELESERSAKSFEQFGCTEAQAIDQKEDSNPFLPPSYDAVQPTGLKNNETTDSVFRATNDQPARPNETKNTKPGQSLLSSTLVNSYLKLVLAAVSLPSYSNREQQFSAAQTKELASFYQVLLQIISKLPTLDPKIQPPTVNCQTIQLLADLRFELGDSQALNEVFFVSLMHTSDFWVNSNDMEVINEFWGFVKAIYSQNPALYNKVFPVRKLVDFMLRISDISKEGAFCCHYHKKTFQMFFTQPDFKLTDEGQIIKKTKPTNQPVYGIRKYLEPIAAVLENVMTTGGDDILDQVQYIAKSLTVKSCPCFHLQMLQLLKVLLLDAKGDDQARKVQASGDQKSQVRMGIRYRFYEVKGLQILLYLCQNAALDVKAMCIKIIDLLSSQTSLIQMRIDTDLITYLSHVILPEQLVQQHLAKQWQNQQHILQHAICEEDEFKLLSEPKTHTSPKPIFDEKDKQGATLQFYAFEEDEQNQQEQDEVSNKQSQESFEEVQAYKAPTAPRGGGRNKKMALFIEESDQNEISIQSLKSDEENADALNQSSEQLVLPDAKKGISLAIESDEEPTQKKAPQKPIRGGLNLDLTDKEMSAVTGYPSSSKDWAAKFKADNEEEEVIKVKDEDAPKPTADVLMSRNLRGGAKKGFNFAAFIEDDSDQEPALMAPPKRGKPELKMKFPAEDDSDEEAKHDIIELPSKPAQRKKPLFIESDEETEKKEANGGTTGTTNDINFDQEMTNDLFTTEEPTLIVDPEPVEDDSPKPLQLTLEKKKTQKKRPNFELAIDTEKINEQFNYGGEHGSLCEEEAIAKLENDIQDLAKYCLEAMRRSTKKRSTFQELLEQQNMSDSDEETKKEALKEEGQQIFMVPQTVKGIKSIEKDILRREREAMMQPKAKIGVDSAQAFSTTFGAIPLDIVTSQEAQEDSEPSDRFAETEKPQAFQKVKNAGKSPQFWLNLDKPNKPQVEMDCVSLNDEVNQNGRVERFFLNLDCDEAEPDANHKKGQTKISGLEGLEDSNSDLEGTIDSYTQELENLYTSCLEWLLNRAPSGLFENLVIDDYDKITFKPALQILMTLVSFSNNMVRQRALQDLFMLAQWDSYCLQYQDQSQQIIANQNGQIILSYPKFHTWLLELMMPYQELIQIQGKKNTQHTCMSESSRAVYDMGCKLHTLLLKNACLNPEEDGFKKVNLLTRWPALIQAQFDSQDKTLRDFGMIKDDKGSLQVQCTNAESDFLIQTAHGLTRSLLTSLIKQLCEEAKGDNSTITLQNAYYRNIVHITVQIEELILSSHTRNQDGLATDNRYKTQISDVNESLFAWLQNGYLLGSNGKNDGEAWAEWELLETLAQSLDWLMPDGKKSVKDFENFSKSAAAIEILMYEGKPSQPSPVHANASQGKTSKVGAFFSSINNGLNQAVQSLTTQYLDTQAQLPDSTFMTALMNLICLAISQAYSKELTVVWLERLESYVKQILVVSEAFKGKQDSYFISVQRKLAEQVSFAFTFLFHEVHNPGTPTGQQQTFERKLSPQQADVQISKLFSQSLKNLLIFFINIVATGGQSKVKDHSASKLILNSILVKEFSSSKHDQLESLISNKDIIFLKESAFEDFPEMFYQNDWKVTFFHNSVIAAIVQKQLNLTLIQQYDERRRNFVLRMREVDSKTEKAKVEILKKIQSDTLDAIGNLSEQEHERKTKEALLLSNTVRNGLYNMRQCFKQVYGVRGMWRQEFQNEFCSAKMHFTGEGTKVLLKSIPSNQLRLIKDSNERTVKQLEKTLFLKVFNSQALMLMRSASYTLLKTALKDYITPSPKTLPKQALTRLKSQNDSEASDENNEDDQEQVKTIQHRNTVQPAFKYVCNDQKAFVSCLKEDLLAQKQPKRKEVIECRCELLLTLENRKGILCMTNYELIFFQDFQTEQEKQKMTIHFFNSVLADDKPCTNEFPLCAIKELQKRRFIGQRTALEVFLIDGRSLLLKFENQEIRDELAKKILRQRKNKCKNLKYYTSLEPKWILKKKSLTEDWQNWKISNFDYIMQLNQLAGRSYNDLSQYPVLPWILNNYQTQKTPDLAAINTVARGGAPPGSFRDLTKNMQLLGSAVRQAEFKRKFEDAEGFIGLEDRFHCGSHYSNPGIVLHYLSRMMPYLEANVELHGKTMDHPDRVFTSIDYSFQNALNDFSDVRELIPEFYFLPEMFLNSNQANFGIKQDGSRVHNVKLPPWAKQDPFKFVQTLREAIESPYVSANLHTWIDFIFGYKQRGPDAQMSLNTFSKITYHPELPDDFDISQEPDPVLRSAYENQAYNYGQTPTQLFKQNERHPQKLNKQQALRSNLVVDLDAHLKVFKPVSGPKNVQGKQPKQTPLITKDAILKARFVDEQRIVAVTKENFAQHFVWLPRAHDLNPTTPFSLGSDKKLGFDSHEKEHGLEQFDRSLKKFDAPIHIMKEGKQIVKGGFWDGRIAFCPTENSNETYYELHSHTSTVTTLICDKKESVMVTGSKTGEVLIWKNSEFDYTLLNNDPKLQQQGQWVCFKKLYDHDRQVSSLFLNEEMNLFVSGSYDGTCNLYNLHSGKLIRTFKHPSMAPVYSAFIALSPLAICSFFSREDHLWTVFSINGTLQNDPSKLTQQERAVVQRNLQEDSSHIIACQVIKDCMHIDKLVYGTEKGFIILRSLPDMVRIRKLVVATNNPVLSILVSPDRRFLHVGCGDGGLIVITERNALGQPEKPALVKK